MQKSIFISILFILIFTYLVNAEYKERLYEGTHLSGSSIQIQDTTFTISFSKTDKIAVSINDSSGFIISKGLCETKLPYEFCFESINFSYHDYAADKDIYKAKIRINGFLARLDIKKEASKTKAEIGDLITITTTIKNTGSMSASNITLADEIPKEFLIEGLAPATDSGCYITENKTIFEGLLDTDISKTCSYILKALKNTTFNAKSSLAYFNGKDSVKLTSPSIIINVMPFPLLIETKLSKDRIALRELFNLYITLKNTDTANILKLSSYEIEIPIGLEITSLPSRLRQDYRKFSWSGNIEPAEQADFSIELMAERAENYKLVSDIIYFINEKRYEVKDTISIPLKQQTENTQSNITTKDTSLPEEKINKSGAVLNLSFKEQIIKANATIENVTSIKLAPISKPKIKVALTSVLISIFGIIISLLLIKRHHKKDIHEIIEFAKKKLREEIKKEERAKGKLLQNKQKRDNTETEIIEIQPEELIKTGAVKEEKVTEEKATETQPQAEITENLAEKNLEKKEKPKEEPEEELVPSTPEEEFRF